jgi:putative ABC transport system permease protein
MHMSLNIFGLAIGLAECALIYLWVQDELSYDTYLTNANRIFRIEQRYLYVNAPEQWPITSGAFGAILTDEYPEIINYCRLWRQRCTFKDYHNSLQQFDIIVTDNSIFDMFDVKLLRGYKSMALKVPDAVIMTLEKAKILFGTENIVNKT